MPMLPKIENKDSGVRLFVRTVFGRAYPRIVGMQRERSWVFFDIFFPMLAVIGFVLVYRTIGAPEIYSGFVVVGGAMTAFWMNVLWSMSSQLYWEKEQGNLALYIISPAPMMAILLGMAVGGLFATSLRAICIIVLGSLIFNVQYAVVSFGSLLGVFFLCMVALYGMGMTMASLYLFFSREAWHLSNLLQEPIFLVSGYYFPVSALPFWVGLAASIIPLTLGLDAMRQLVFSGGGMLGFLTVEAEVAVIAVLGVVFLILARILLKKVEKLAIREGRLTENRR
jgi:ABC-2 type transport system permease protein